MVDGVLLLVVVVEVVVLLVLLIVVVVLVLLVVVDGGSALAADRSTLEPASSKLSSNRFKMYCFKNLHCTAFKRKTFYSNTNFVYTMRYYASRQVFEIFTQPTPRSGDATGPQ